MFSSISWRIIIADWAHLGGQSSPAGIETFTIPAQAMEEAITMEGATATTRTRVYFNDDEREDLALGLPFMVKWNEMKLKQMKWNWKKNVAETLYT